MSISYRQNDQSVESAAEHSMDGQGHVGDIRKGIRHGLDSAAQGSVCTSRGGTEEPTKGSPPNPGRPLPRHLDGAKPAEANLGGARPGNATEGQQASLGIPAVWC